MSGVEQRNKSRTPESPDRPWSSSVWDSLREYPGYSEDPCCGAFPAMGQCYLSIIGDDRGACSIMSFLWTFIFSLDSRLDHKQNTIPRQPFFDWALSFPYKSPYYPYCFSMSESLLFPNFYFLKTAHFYIFAGRCQKAASSSCSPQCLGLCTGLGEAVPSWKGAQLSHLHWCP